MDDWNGRLLEAYDALIAGLNSVKDFAVEQIPIVLQQLLAWEFTINLIGFVCAIVLLIIITGVVLWGCKYCVEEGEPPVIPIILLVSSFIYIPIGYWINNTIVWLKILIAPKVFLIEYLSELVK